jgi:TonB family protein
MALAIVLAACGCTRDKSTAPIMVAEPDVTVAKVDAPAPSPPIISLEGDVISVDGRTVSEADLGKALGGASEAIVEAPAATPWGRVVHLVDLAKQQGAVAFALAVKGEPARRTQTIRLPKASSRGLALPEMGSDGSVEYTSVEMTRMISVTKDGALSLDGNDRASVDQLGDFSQGAVIVAGDTQAPFGIIVDVARVAMRGGAQVAFSVSKDAVAATPPPPTGSKPRSRGDAGKNCVFPSEARKAGIEHAVVTLRIKVDARGKPKDVVVISDPGHGFGESAKTCAKKMDFDPARDDAGKAIDGETVMRIRFELDD